jgi:hypothetical protein
MQTTSSQSCDMNCTDGYRGVYRVHVNRCISGAASHSLPYPGPREKKLYYANCGGFTKIKAAVDNQWIVVVLGPTTQFRFLT